MNEQHVAWARWSGPGHEHLVLREVPLGLTAHSTVEGFWPIYIRGIDQERLECARSRPMMRCWR